MKCIKDYKQIIVVTFFKRALKETSKTQDVRIHRQAECTRNHSLVLKEFIYSSIHQKINNQSCEVLKKLTDMRFEIENLQQLSLRVLYQNRLQNIVEAREE